jgi:orotate phosphoribosyltransferase/uridine monophosphate synthetase
MLDQSVSNLWLAQALWHMGAVQFGDFTLGRSTVHSPIYINPRLLVGEPMLLRRAASLVEQETRSGQAMRHPRCAPFDLVAGVPYGGLHLATAYSLNTNVPMIYARRSGEEPDRPQIEGRYSAGQTVLIIDDLATTGGSILETASILKDAGLVVKDAIVLVDREQGAGDRLRRHGYILISVLRLTVMLNHYLAEDLITREQFDRCIGYLEANKAA